MVNYSFSRKRMSKQILIIFIRKVLKSQKLVNYGKVEIDHLLSKIIIGYNRHYDSNFY